MPFQEVTQVFTKLALYIMCYRITELVDRTSGVEEQVSLVEARLSRSLSKPTIDPLIEAKVLELCK